MMYEASAMELERFILVWPNTAARDCIACDMTARTSAQRRLYDALWAIARPTRAAPTSTTAPTYSRAASGKPLIRSPGPRAEGGTGIGSVGGPWFYQAQDQPAVSERKRSTAAAIFFMEESPQWIHVTGAAKARARSAPLR